MDGLDGIIGPWSLLLHIIDRGPFSFALSLDTKEEKRRVGWNNARTQQQPPYIYRSVYGANGSLSVTVDVIVARQS